jgi:hypothetical protein
MSVKPEHLKEIGGLLAKMAIENIPTAIDAIRAMSEGRADQASRLARRAGLAQAAKLAVRSSLKKPAG